MASFGREFSWLACGDEEAGWKDWGDDFKEQLKNHFARDYVHISTNMADELRQARLVNQDPMATLLNRYRATGTARGSSPPEEPVKSSEVDEYLAERKSILFLLVFDFYNT